MSRRKQTHPRHLESELELAAILENGTAKSATPSPDSPPREDAHVCGRCRADFLELVDFLAHKKSCSRKRIVVTFDEDEQRESMEANPTEGPRLSNPNDDTDSIGEVERNSIDDDMDDYNSDKSDDESLEDLPPTLVNGMKRPNIDEDDEDEENLLDKYNSIMDKSRLSSLKANLPQLSLPLNPLNSFLQSDNSNVMLEPLSTTKAAVAQFAENNLPPSDLAVLHTALYSLQQQQLVQLQLIQQLQGQLLLGMNPTTNVQLPPMPPTLTPPTPGSVGPAIPLPTQFTCIGPNPSAATTPVFPDGSTANNNNNNNHHHSNGTDKSDSESSKKPSDFRSANSTPTNCKMPLTPIDTPKSFEDPKRAPPPGLLSTPNTPSYTSYPQFKTAPPLDKSPNSPTSAIDKSQFVSDDPFFKHKCRMCHKVFGSDSALQIHIRSHTDFAWPTWSSKYSRRSRNYKPGERPFKCNICGNRFSTRGNLKVHFTRHRAKYPHVSMNPHPVPEHLDHLPTRHHRSSSGMSHGIPGHHGHHPSPIRPTPPYHHHRPEHRPDQRLPPPPPPPPHMMPITSGLVTPPQTPASIDTKPQLPAEFSSSPVVPPSQHRFESSPTIIGSEAPARTSPEVKETANTSTTSQADSHRNTITSPSASTPSTLKLSSPILSSLSSSIASISNMIMAGPAPTSLPMSLAMMSPTIMTAMPHFSPIIPPPMDMGFISPRSVMGGSENGDGTTHSSDSGSIVPTKTIEPGENMEEYMECSKSETSKLEQLVQNIEKKLTDPNQCLICHRVLSCKSALQMHYRIHTGERPFRCKICGRSFTTKGNLKTHMGVHRAKPPMRMMHQCPVCHKQFTNLLVLQQHIRMHTIGTGAEHLPRDNPFRALEWTPRLPFHDHPFGIPRVSESGFPSFAVPKRDPEQLTELDLSKRPLDDSPSIKIEKADHKMDIDDEEDKKETGEEELEQGRDLMVNGESRLDSYRSEDDMSDENDEFPDEKMNDNDKHEDRPMSAMSTGSESLTSPIPRLMESQYTPLSMTHPLMLGGYNHLYSTSLAALEERVKAIDSVAAFRPMERMRESLEEGKGSQRIDPPTVSPGSNHELSYSRSLTSSPAGRAPSETGSAGSKDEGGKAKSYAGSICSDEGSNMYYPILSPGGTVMNLNRPGMDGKSNTTCNICYKTFACRSALEIHYRSHTKERPFKCDVCDRCFSTRGNMKQHMLTHKIRDLPDAFGEPDEENENENEIEHEHNQNENERESIKPEDQNGNSNPESTTPSANHRPSSASSGCSETPSPFMRRGPAKHQCQVCMKHFSSASALQIHIRTHTGDKPFKCTVCGKAFTTKGNLKVHMGTHMWNNSPSRRGRRMSIEPPFMFGPKDNPFLAAAAAAAYPHRSPDFFFQYPPPFLNGLAPKQNEISVIQSLNSGMNHNGPLSYPSPMTSPNSKEENHNDARTTNREKEHANRERDHTSREMELSSREREHSSREMERSSREREHSSREKEHSSHEREHSNREKEHSSCEREQSGRERANSGDRSEKADSLDGEDNVRVSNLRELDLSMKATSASSGPSSASPPSPSTTPTREEAHEAQSQASLSPWMWKSTCHICSMVCSSPTALEHHIRAQHFRENAPQNIAA